MKHIINRLVKSMKSIKGNSLAEFATTTALMATLAATAAPKLSQQSEGTKAEKSRNEIDKILKIAAGFYQKTAAEEGRGRFPNQVKFNVSVGGPNGATNYSNTGSGGTYSITDDRENSNDHELAILTDLGFVPSAGDGWNRFDEAHANQWQQVFSEALPTGVVGVNQAGDNNEFMDGFESPLSSSFQDGHYVYTVVAGGGTGIDSYPPVIYVADIESVVDFNNLLEP